MESIAEGSVFQHDQRVNSWAYWPIRLTKQIFKCNKSPFYAGATNNNNEGNKINYVMITAERLEIHVAT